MDNNYIIAIYIRLSIEDTKVKSLSINTQRAALRKHAETLVDNNYEIIEFVDNGYTGTNFERPAMQELLELVRNCKINCIIVKDFSRFGRNFIETSYFIEKVFPLFHIRFISINNDFDTIKYTGDTGGMQVAFQHLMNEYYSIDLSVKSKSAKYAKMKKGEYQSIVCCYGYKKSANNRLEIDDEAAEAVKMIFDMSLNGMLNSKIAKELYEQNILTPRQYKAKNGNKGYDIARCCNIWNLPGISRILSDERYIGTYIIGKHTVREVGSTKMRLKDEKEWIKIPNHHPAIINEAAFKKVQKVRRTFKSPKNNKKQYPLCGKVICGCCQHTMSRVDRKSPMFYCRHTSIAEKAMCYKLNILEKDLHNMLFEIINKQATALLGIEKLDNINLLEDILGKEAEYKTRIQECYDNKLHLYEQYQLRKIHLQYYQTSKAIYDDKLTELKNIYSNISVQSELLKTEKNRKEKLLEIANTVKEQDSLNKIITDLLIDKVLIYPQNYIEI